MDFRGKNVTVVGLARSGVGAARLLAALGARVTASDRRHANELPAAVAALPKQVRLVLGGHPEEIFSDADMIVISPGVPLDIAPVAAALRRGVPVISELELAFIASRFLWNGSGGIPFLAVTGSNGKSTTTSLLDLMMRKSGFRTILGGNIGNALTEEILSHREEKNSPADRVVVEVSSFQLEAVREFRPKVASVLNVTPDHLDRYRSLEEYAAAKARIFSAQKTEDFLVLNADDAGAMRLHDQLAARAVRPGVFFFSRTKEVRGVYCRDGMVVANLGPSGAASPLIRADEIRIRGVHNLENAMAAAAMALLAGASAAAVAESLREFPGLEHRLELVRELDGVRYINDSKGTNVGAVEKSLESFSGPVVLIAGGRDKAGDFAALRPRVKGRVRAIVLIGEAAHKIRSALGDLCETVPAADLRDAVLRSRAIAQPGDVVLLSPACASFDMFADFEDRGRQFKKIVGELDA
ncbi:MAG: UDP-N-acetylmuramoyl-L-alanine--D-glutamate ligase [Thermodesulfovibrionales bacterium]